MLNYKVKVKVKSCPLFETPWTVAHQSPPSMGFSRQEYWSGLPFPSPGDLPDPRIEPRSPELQADALTSEPPGKPGYYKIMGITPVLYNISLLLIFLCVVVVSDNAITFICPSLLPYPHNQKGHFGD